MTGSRRILLIYPPFFRLFDDQFSLNRYPLGMAYLAGAIKANSSWQAHAYNADFNPDSNLHDTSITFTFRAHDGHGNYLRALEDERHPIWQEIRHKIETIRPDVVGITSLSQIHRAAVRIAKLTKSVDPATRTIVGGPHPSMVGGEVLDCKDIDIAVRGEGENTLLELLQYFDRGGDLREVKGIVYRDAGSLVETEPREYIPDLDTLCFPHDGAPDLLIDYERYPRSAFGSIFAARGCPYSCTFCGSRNIWSRKVRFRSPQNVAEEMSRLQAKGVVSVRFADDTFGIHRAWTEAACKEIRNRCPGLKWKCEMNVGAVRADLLAAMKSSGCYMIELGIESGDNRVLKEIRKNTTIESALQASKMIVDQGIELQVYFMAGFPQETEESLENTRKAIEKIKGYICFNVYSPFPGSALHALCKERGLIDDAYDVCLHNFQTLEGFSENISKERFRQLAAEMIQLVDRKNHADRIKRIFSANTLWRIRELGARKAAVKGMQVLARPFFGS